MSYRITTLSSEHDRIGFSCGDDEVDNFLKQKALQDQKLDLSRTYVLVDLAREARTIIGYYTIVPIAIRQDDVFESEKPKIKREMPALLLGQLGVNSEYKALGFGELLLVNAEFKAASASEIVGIRTMVLDARNESLAKWYSKYGYSRIGTRLRMAKNIADIRKSNTELRSD